MSKRRRSRQRNDPRKTRRRAPVPPVAVGESGPLQLLTYTVTTEPLDIPEKGVSIDEVLSDDERATIFEQCHRRPREVIPRLERLLAQHPDVPTLYNWLAAAYGHAGEVESAERIARLNYERNPEYLFARLNHATMCLRRGDIEQIPIIFDGKFDLKLMYPHRNVFHVTEYVAFCGVFIEYFARTGETEAAKRLYEVLRELAPDHPITRQTRRWTETSTLQRALQRILRARRPSS